MKSPDEIKKGLEQCVKAESSETGCRGCPYIMSCVKEEDPDSIMADSLSYIQQLESDNESKQKRIDELESRLAQVEKENAALLNDLKTADQECLYCKRNQYPDEKCCCECGECQTPCTCLSCKGNRYYLWRGVCPENAKEDSTC